MSSMSKNNRESIKDLDLSEIDEQEIDTEEVESDKKLKKRIEELRKQDPFIYE